MSCSKGQGHCTAPSIPRLNQDLIVGQASIAKCGGKTNDAFELRMSGPVWPIPVPMGLHMSYMALPVTLTYMLSRPYSMHLFCLCPNAAYLIGTSTGVVALQAALEALARPRLPPLECHLPSEEMKALRTWML